MPPLRQNPIKSTDRKWVPNFNNRYFCEDLLLGLVNTCTSAPQRFGIHSVQNLVEHTFKDV